MTRALAAALFVIAAILAPSVHGATALEETRALEEQVSKDPKKAIETAREEFTRAEAANDKPARLKALRLLAMAYDNLDDNPGLRETSRTGLALAIELGDKQAQVELMTAQGMAAFNEGRIEEAIRQQDRAIAAAREAGLERELAKAYIAKSHALVAMERSSEAMETLLKAHAILEKLGERLLLSGTLSAVGNILTNEDSSREELMRAVDYHRRAMALVDPSSKYELSTIYYNLGVAYSYLKDYPEAMKLLEKCLAIGREINDPHTIAYVSYRLGSIAIAQGKAAEALPRFDAALPAFRAAENLQLELLTQLGRARALAATGKRSEAISALTSARPLVNRLKSPGRDVRYYEAAADTYAKIGDWEAAFAQMRELREAERRVVTATNQRQAKELQARFGGKQRETEYELLRAEGQIQESRRILLLMALVLMGVFVLALVAYVMRQTRQKRRFAALAMRDDLTGLPNRRSILEFAKAQFRGRRAGDTGFVLALIDIDHFKKINDELGHSVGDEVLRAFGQAGLHAMRSEDRLGRFGGEEFVLVMPGVAIEAVPAGIHALAGGRLGDAGVGVSRKPAAHVQPGRHRGPTQRPGPGLGHQARGRGALPCQEPRPRPPRGGLKGPKAYKRNDCTLDFAA